MSRLTADFIDTLAGAAGRVMADLTETFRRAVGGRFMRVTVDGGFHRHVSGGCRASHGRLDGDVSSGRWRAFHACHG